MKKFLIVFLSIILVGGAGFAGWYFFLREEKLFVEFYGEESVVEFLSGEGEYKEGESVTLTAEEREGYTFDSWVKDGSPVSTSRIYTFTMSKSTSGKYTAKYNAKEFTISTQNNGVYNIANKAVTDEIVVVNIAVPDGFHVTELYYVEAGTSERVDIINNQFKMPPNNVSIFVSIEETVYTITYNLDGGTFNVGFVETFTISTSTFTLPKPSKLGYNFIGYTFGTTGTPEQEITITKGTKENIVVYAHWNLAHYSKDIGNIEGQGTIDIYGSIAEYNSEQFILVDPADHWKLKELYYIKVGTSTKIYIINNRFTMPAFNIKIYVVFEKVQYSISQESAIGGMLIIQETAGYGDSVTVTSQADMGYIFDSVYYVCANDPEEIQHPFEDSFTMPGCSITIYVTFAPIYYPITYVLYDGTLPANAPINYCVESSEIVLPIPTKVGHDFVGWYDNPSFTGNVITSFSPYSYSGKTFYAKYTAYEYTISFINYDGTELQSGDWAYGTTPVYSGETPTKPETAEVTYAFAGWSPEIVSVTDEATYTATFTTITKTYSITQAQTNTQMGTFTCQDSAEVGATVVVNAIPASEYIVSKMYYTKEGFVDLIEFTNSFVMPAANVQVYVLFEKIKYTISKESCDGGEITVQETASYGDVITVTQSADLGYSFEDSYYICENDQEETKHYFNGSFTMPGCNVTVGATFDEISYTITYNLDGGTLPEGAITSYTVNSGEITLLSPIKENYDFIGWYDNQTQSGSAITSFDSSSCVNKTFYAFYTLKTFLVQFVNYDGSVLQSGNCEYGSTPVYSGETPTKPETAEVTYAFAGWSPEIVSVTDEATYTATFTAELKTYTITPVKGNVSVGTFTVHGSGKVGSTVFVNTNPASGYYVAGMYYIREGDTEQIRFSETFTMPAVNVSVYVVFRNSNMETV